VVAAAPRAPTVLPPTVSPHQGGPAPRPPQTGDGPTGDVDVDAPSGPGAPTASNTTSTASTASTANAADSARTSAAPETSSAPKTTAKEEAPQQGTSDLDALYKQAEVADAELRGITNQIAEQTGGSAVFPPGLKGRTRASEKIDADYGGDASRLLDISRSSIEFENVAALRKGLADLEQRGIVVRMKDRFSSPTAGGYRDIMLNVRMSNGHICEVQLHLKQILAVKGGPGHKIYEEMRAIEAASSRVSSTNAFRDRGEKRKKKARTWNPS